MPNTYVAAAQQPGVICAWGLTVGEGHAQFVYFLEHLLQQSILRECYSKNTKNSCKLIIKIFVDLGLFLASEKFSLNFWHIFNIYHV
jgi:hypothetical protein